MIEPPLRDYQREAVEHIYRQHKVILADEQGLGKTLTALTSLLKLMQQPQMLILCPKVALGTWQHEAKKWFGLESIIYSGESKPNERKALMERYKTENPPLLIATYAMMKEILMYQVGWQSIVCDEYHKIGLMNHRTTTFKTFKQFQCLYMLLLTGTPVKRGPENLFAPLHLINPFRFPSYWSFVNRHCIVIEGMFGKEIEPRPKDPIAFRDMLKPYLIRRTKRNVLKELPPLIRSGLYVDMTPKQKQYYDEIADTGMIDTPQGMIICPNGATKLMRLRQILCTPRSFGFEDKGGAIETLEECILDSFEAGIPVAICTPFKAGVREIEGVLHSICKKVYLIHGDMKGMPGDVSRAFQADPEVRKAIVFTITSGMSWDAYSASNIYFVGAEWTATDNAQAESRIHRLGQVLPTNAYYILYPNTIDEAIIERLDQKEDAANWVLDTDRMLELLRKQREKYGKTTV